MLYYYLTEMHMCFILIGFVNMARKYKRTLGSRQYVSYSSEKLEKALLDIRSGKLTQRQASVSYNIPRSTLKNKLKGAHPNKYGGPTVFSSEEEDIFKSYVVTASAFGFPVDIFDLRCIVKGYADKKGIHIRQFVNNLPGTDWVASFLKRHKDLSVRFASNIKRKRAEVDTSVIEEYFRNLESELEGVPPQNIWNYDETNLSDDPGQKKVVTKRGCKYPERVINSTKAAVSLMFCGNAAGEVLPPYVVYKAESLWSTWMEHGPPHTRYNRSKSGWFDSTCFEDWFMSMLLPRLKKTEGRHIVIGDNLSSHLNPTVLAACQENNVAFVALPTNSTHLTQPLDVAYFRPMKIIWRKILSEWKEKGKGRRAPSLPKDEFPRLLNCLMNKLKEHGKDNLTAGFRKAGIFPLDKSQVMSRLPSDCANHGAGGDAGSDVSAGIGSPSSTSELVSQSFLDHLSHARGDGQNGATRRKRRKVSAVPGKSLSADDVVPAGLPTGAKSALHASASSGNQGTGSSSAVGTSTSAPLTADQNDDLNLEEDSSDTCTDTDTQSSPETDVEPDDTTDRVQSISKLTSTSTLVEDSYVIVTYDNQLYPGQVGS